MSWQVRFQEEVHRRHPGAGAWFTRLSRQPGWVTKTATIAALLVVVVPIIALTLAALLIGTACLLVLGIIASVWRFVTSPFTGPRAPKDDGRRNVQVIERP